MTEPNIWRWLVGSGLALASMGAVTAFTLSMTRAPSAPAFSLAKWPTSLGQSGAAAKLIASEAEMMDPQRRARAAQLASQALARSPVNVEAVRTLALVEAVQGRVQRARAFISYGERLSRRDLPTQMWLIEDRVQAGDVASALLHYHHAMQTFPASRDLLSPILAQAADDPVIAHPLAKILATRPQWWSNFLGDFVERTHSADALTLVTTSLHLDARNPVERERLSTIFQRYIVLGKAAAARRLYDRVAGVGSDPVTDGDFEHDRTLVPFGWQLASTTGSAGVREPRDGASGAFALTLDGNERQEAARQLLVLSTGRYVLRLKYGSVAPKLFAAPTMSVRCAAPDRPIAEQELPTTSKAAVLEMMFTVPPACDTQLLIARTPRAIGGYDAMPWIDDVTITSQPNSNGK